MRKHLALVMLFLGTAFPVAVEAAQTAQGLSFTEAVAIALRSNPAYLASQADVEGAQARVRAARAPLGPSVTLSDGFQSMAPVAALQTPFGALPFSPNTTNLPLASINYTLFDGATAARIARADARLAGIAAERRETRGATIGRVGETYFDLAAALGVSDSSDRAVATASDHERLAQDRFRLGAAPRADVLQAQTRLADARLRAIDARAAVERASIALDAALGVPLSTTFRPTDALDAPAPDLSLESAIAAAETSRGELSAAHEAVVAARRAVEEAKSARAPRVGMTVSEGNVQPVVQPGLRGQFTVALNAVWTVYDNGATNANVAVAEASVRRAGLDVDALRVTVESEVRRAYSDLAASRQRVAAAKTLVDLAIENARLSDVRYRGGVGTIYELRDAELQETAARQTLITAEAGLRRAVVALRVAAGIE